jgi:hypothetical protein
MDRVAVLALRRNNQKQHASTTLGQQRSFIQDLWTAFARPTIWVYDLVDIAEDTYHRAS